MVQISNLNKSVRTGEGKSLGAGSERSGKNLSNSTSIDRLVSGYTSEERLSGLTSNSGQTPNEQQLTESLVSDLKAKQHEDPKAFRQAMQTAFKGKASPAAIDALATKILSGEAKIPNKIEFVDSDVLGPDAKGAYDPKDGGTIYLSRELIGNPDQLTAVFTEETGHHYDAVLGGKDAAGDEGDIFASTLLKGPLSRADLTSMRSEKDTGYIVVDGKRTSVEFNGYGGTGSNSESGGTPSPSPTPSPSGRTDGPGTSGLAADGLDASLDTDTKQEDTGRTESQLAGNAAADAAASKPQPANSTTPAYSGLG